MGILDKLKFWKKGDDFSDFNQDFSTNNPNPFSSDFGSDFQQGQQSPDSFGQGQFGQGQGQDFQSQHSGFGQGPQSGFQQQDFSSPFPPQSQPSPRFQQQFQPPQQRDYSSETTSKDLEVISSKLDALRASIESVNQRLANLESIARGDEEERRRRYY